MKKFIISVICCLILFGGFYLYKNKNRLYYKYKHRDDPNGYEWHEGMEENSKTTKTSNFGENKEVIDELKKTVEQFAELNKKLGEKISEQNDSMYVMSKTIDSLRIALDSKPKIKIQSSPYDYTPTVKNSKSFKNEKNLPIARSNDAVKLKEFFTERYDNRR